MSLKKEVNIFLRYPGWTAGVLTLLSLVVWRVVTGFNGLYGQDSYAYVEYGSWLQTWIAGGDLPEAFFWPAGYPTLGALLGYIVGDLTFAFQLISMLSMSLTVGLLASLGSRSLSPRTSILLSIACIALSPYLLRSGLSCMSDSLAVAIMALSLWIGEKYREDGRSGWLIGLIFLLAYGTWVRYPLGLLLGAVVLMHLPIAWKKRQFLPLLIGILFAGIPLYLHLRLQANAVPNHHFLESWTPQNWFKRAFVMKDGTFSYKIPNLPFALGPFYHPGYLGLATILVPLSLLGWRKMDRIGKGYLITIGLFILFIAGIPFQNTRFLVVLIPLCALYFYRSSSMIESRLDKKTGVLLSLVLGLVVLNIGIVYYANAQFWNSAQKEQRIATAVKGFNPERVYTFGMDGVIRHYLPQTKVINLWNEDLSPGEWATSNHPGSRDFLLFNETQFAEQWAGKSPMVNWEHLNQTYQLDSLAIFEGGWTLHEIR